MTVCEGYEFTNDGGKFHVDGKAYWPNMLRFSITKRDAVELALIIIDRFHRDVRSGEYDPSAMIQFSSLGTLVRAPDDDTPHPHRGDHSG